MSNEIEIYTMMRIQSHPAFYYTVEDFNVEVGDRGITISYREVRDRGKSDSVDRMITIGSPDEAIAIAEAMIELAENLKRNG